MRRRKWRPGAERASRHAQFATATAILTKWRSLSRTIGSTIRASWLDCAAKSLQRTLVGDVSYGGLFKPLYQGGRFVVRRRLGYRSDVQRSSHGISVGASGPPIAAPRLSAHKVRRVSLRQTRDETRKA